MADRRTVIAGNWKMYKTVSEAEDYVIRFLEEVRAVTDLDIVLCAVKCRLVPVRPAHPFSL